MDHSETLEGVQREVIFRAATVLSAVRLLGLAAPFCDLALTTIVEDLEQLLTAAHQAQALTDQLSRIIAGPTAPTAPLKGSPR
jgi:hypothetical protein